MNNSNQAPAFFAKLEVEVNNLSPAEIEYINRLTKLVTTTPVTDCRMLKISVAARAEELDLEMVVGCGGSHIYIHRESEFVSGDNTNAKNIRFAIIRDN